MHLISIFLFKDAMRGALLLVAAVLIAELAHYVLYKLLWRLQAWRGNPSSERVLRYTAKCSQPLFVIIGFTIAFLEIRSTDWDTTATGHILEVGYIAAFTWLIVSFIEVGYALIVRRLPEDVQDNVRTRRVQTQVYLLRQIAIWIVVFIGFAAILMTFPSIRNVGAGLFASAGVAGLVLGMAARPTLGNLIAGVQIAMSQPIRIGDFVVVEGESGRILEINTTYVVIRLWDLRHLIVPISHFIEKSFENWTRYSSELIGAVLLQVDYSVPIESIREHYNTVLAESPLWDGKTSTMQVTDVTASAVEIRFLMSAQSVASVLDLRYHVREKMLTYLQKHHPEALPKIRADIGMTENTTPQSSPSQGL